MSISIGSFAAIVLAAAAFADQSDIEQRFPISFFIDQTDGKIIKITTRASLLEWIDQMGWQHASAFYDPADKLSEKPYHLALQRMLIEWLNLPYNHSWRIESIRDDSAESWRWGPMPGVDDTSTLVPLSDVAQQFSSGSPPVSFSPHYEDNRTPPRTVQPPRSIELQSALSRCPYCPSKTHTVSRSAKFPAIFKYSEIETVSPATPSTQKAVDKQSDRQDR